MEVCAAAQGRLVALHDTTFASAADPPPLLQQRNVLRFIDVEQKVRAPVPPPGPCLRTQLLTPRLLFRPGQGVIHRAL